MVSAPSVTYSALAEMPRNSGSRQLLPGLIVQLSGRRQLMGTLECSKSTLQVTPRPAIDLTRGEPAAIKRDLGGEDFVDDGSLLR